MQEKASSKSADAAAEAKTRQLKGVINHEINIFSGVALSHCFALCLCILPERGRCCSRKAGFVRGQQPSRPRVFSGCGAGGSQLHIRHRIAGGNFELSRQSSYLNGDYAQARSTLEKALAQHKSDNVARLYLGLTLARQGETQKGLQDIDAGMEGIYDFLDHMTDSFRFSFGKDWDPGRDIRSAIERDRAMIASGKIDWPALIADGEWIAMKIEREPDLRNKPTVRD
jgi:hypothetical protein